MSFQEQIFLMPKLRILSSKEIIKFLEKQDFIFNRQKGSHIVLVRVVSFSKQVLTIPNHARVDKGTIKALYNQISRFIPESDLQKLFYTK